MPLLLLIAVVVLGAFGTASAHAAKPRPDLVVSRVSASLVAGDRVQVEEVTKNAGSAKTARSTTSLWLSVDAKRGDDVALGKRTLSALKAKKSSTRASSVALPASTKPGTYTVLACADDGRKVKERSEANNCKGAKLVVARGGTLPSPAGAAPAAAAHASAPPAPQPSPAPVPTVAPVADGADLAVAEVSDPPAVAREGSAFAVTDSVANGGSAPAGASAVRFYLSPDSDASLRERRENRADPRVALRDVRMGGFRDVPALASQARSDAPPTGTQAMVPVGIAPGVYHLLACADDRGAVAEATEDDNCRVATYVDAQGVERPSPVQILAEEQEYRVDAFSDLLEQPDEADDVADLEQLSRAFCTNPLPYTAHSLPSAIASIERSLAERAPGAAAQFAASPEYQDATKAEAVAGAAITAGLPGAALAALVRAHQLEPAESSHLVNGAAVASSVGLPSEALALLDAARRLEDDDRPAMGIARHAVDLANRGQALAMLGRLPEADAALAGAFAAEPLLSEANYSRAATTVCREGAAPAAKFLRAGRKRQPSKALDISRGRETPLREFELPPFPRQAAEMRAFYFGQSQKLLGESGDQNAQASVLEGRIATKREEWTDAQNRRFAWTLNLIYGAGDEADIAALDSKVDEALDQVIDTQRDFWGDNEREDYEYRVLSDAAQEWCAGDPNPRCFPERMNDTCRPKLRLAHQEWLDEMQETIDAAEVLMRAASKRMSAYATHLADEDANALALLQVKQYERALYGRILQWAQQWTHSVQLHSDHCVEPLEQPAPGAPPEAPDVDSDGACSPALKAISGTWELGPTKIKISCEQIQQSFKFEVVPWLQAYSEVTYNFRHGRLTVFGGTKGEISAGVAKGAFKSGMYVTVHRNGFVDAGWRVGPSASVGAGPVEFEVFKDEVDISFIGAVSATFGL